MNNNKTLQKLSLRQFILFLALCLLFTQPAWSQPINIIIMIGDGMGFEQVKAASIFATSAEEMLPFEKHYLGEVTTHSADSYLSPSHATDSAAGATALATGHKAKNGVISQDEQGNPFQTILEFCRDKGKMTGLITTVPITHATPAGFGAHAQSRNQYDIIADVYLTQTRPNLLFGAYFNSGQGMTEEKATKAKYIVVKNRTELGALVFYANTRHEADDLFISGQFAPEQLPWEYDMANPLYAAGLYCMAPDTPEFKSSYDTAPHLSEMTGAALDILDNHPEGFFLMIEGGLIDWAGHNNNIERSVFETMEFAQAFQVVSDWAQSRDDTMVLVTADHETGGLKVIKNKGKGFFPQVTWTTGGHTGANVPLYGFGPSVDHLTGVIDNTSIFRFLLSDHPSAQP
jgi:alkaline phosphatase